jgi:hypothetical protein
LFAIYDAEEAAYVWMKRSLHNSISYTTLIARTLVAISFELAIFMAAAAWATESGTSNLAIFTLRCCCYMAHGFFHLYLGCAPTSTLSASLPFVVFGLFIYDVAFDPCCSLGRFDLRLRSAVTHRADRKTGNDTIAGSDGRAFTPI